MSNININTNTASLQWLVLPAEWETTYTNWGDGHTGDASALIERANADQEMGLDYANWRLPTVEELRARLETEYRPGAAWYWASEGSRGTYEKVVSSSGVVSVSNRGLGYRVRLVRDAIAAYHAALAKFDWDFDTRDDHQRWAEGHNALARLRKMQAEVDPTGEIWMSYPGARGHGAPAPRIQEVA